MTGANNTGKVLQSHRSTSRRNTNNVTMSSDYNNKLILVFVFKKSSSRFGSYLVSIAILISTIAMQTQHASNPKVYKSNV